MISASLLEDREPVEAEVEEQQLAAVVERLEITQRRAAHLGVAHLHRAAVEMTTSWPLYGYELKSSVALEPTVPPT